MVSTIAASPEPCSQILSLRSGAPSAGFPLASAPWQAAQFSANKSLPRATRIESAAAAGGASGAGVEEQLLPDRQRLARLRQLGHVLPGELLVDRAEALVGARGLFFELLHLAPWPEALIDAEPGVQRQMGER